MKLCLCISGQVRGDYSNLINLKKNLENLSNEIDITVIFSLWENSGHKNSGGMSNQNQASRLFDEEVVMYIPDTYYGNNFWNMFPKINFKSLSNLIKEVKEEIFAIFPSSIIDIEKENLHLEFSQLNIDRNSKKMLYKVWRCNEIKSKIESSKGKFDCVLRIRVDAIFEIFNLLAKKQFKENEIFLDLWFDKYPSDQLAYGSSSVLNYYSNLFSRSLFKSDWKGIHYELHEWLIKEGILIRKPDVIVQNGLVKPDVLLKLDNLKHNNRFFDLLIKLNSIDDPKIMIEKIDEQLCHNQNKFEKISLYYLRSKVCIELNDLNGSFNSFIKGHLFEIEHVFKKTSHQISRQKQIMIKNKLLDYCKKLKLFSIDAMIQNIHEENKTKILIDNINSSIDQNFKSWFENRK